MCNRENDEEKASKLQAWTRERLDSFWEKLLSFVTDEACLKHGITDLSVASLFKIIKAFHGRRRTLESKILDHWSGEEVKRFRPLMPLLCSNSQSCQASINKFKELFEYFDVKEQAIQGLAKFVKQFAKPGSSSPSFHLKSNIFSLLELVKFSKPSPKEPLRTLLCLSEDEDEESSLFKFDLESSRKTFSDLWEQVLKFPMDSTLYKRVLVILTDEVLPHLSRPLLLTDFFMTSYAVGGAVSVLALNGVFTLIQKYNLEYPDFYIKLYALFQPDVLAAKYRARFFYLADIFLTSSHIPEYLVAAFAKKLARLCLSAPANR